MGAVLLLWCGCALSIALSIFRFAWVATAGERLLVLGLLLTAGLFALRGRR